MSSDPCRNDLPQGVNRLRRKAVENPLNNNTGSSTSQVDQDRVDAIVEKWESRADLDKVQGGK